MLDSIPQFKFVKVCIPCPFVFSLDNILSKLHHSPGGGGGGGGGVLDRISGREVRPGCPNPDPV